MGADSCEEETEYVGERTGKGVVVRGCTLKALHPPVSWWTTLCRGWLCESEQGLQDAAVQGVGPAFAAMIVGLMSGDTESLLWP
jgi:hypothetical protein